MKLIKKIAAIMLSIMMVLGMASVVSASENDSTVATGNGKITITNAIPKQTYKIYRILELESYNTTTGNYAYKATSAWKSFIEGNEIQNVYVTINNGCVTWKEGANAVEFAKKALEYANTNKLKVDKKETAPDAAVGENTSKVIFSDLPLGYYLVDSSVGALCSLDTTATEVEIQEKNGVPAAEKKVQEDSKIGAADEWGDSNTADIGQIVNFQTTITAQQGAQNYVLHDKMDAGLTFGGTVTVKKGDTTLVSPIDYSLITDGANITDGCTFEIVFTQTFCDTLATNDQIIVTYSATLNENAVPKTEYTNETWLKYGDDNDTNHDTTKTKTFELPVFKYTKDGKTEKALAGATFTLSKNANGRDPIKLVSVSKDDTTGDIYRVAKENEATGTTKITEITTTKSGKFTIKGLDADTYYLTETKQPDGYNKLSAPITVVIDENGNITVDTTTVNEVKVENNTGSILPSTGGSGTTLIYILGAILVLGSSVVLITKKRMR